MSELTCILIICRKDPPGQSAVLATQELLRLTEANPDGLPTLDPVKDLKLRNLDMVDKFEERSLVENTVDKFNCIHCFNFKQHVSRCLMMEALSLYYLAKCIHVIVGGFDFNYHILSNMV